MTDINIGVRQESSDQVRRNVVTMWAEDSDRSVFAAIVVPHPATLDPESVERFQARLRAAVQILMGEVTL